MSATNAAADAPTAGRAGAEDGDVAASIREFSELRDESTGLESEWMARGDGVSESWRPSAANLLHYLALRRRDLRDAQMRLAEMGLSSLGRSEPHVLANLDAVLRVLHRLAGRTWTPGAPSAAPSFADGERLLREHADALFGPEPDGRSVRIVVTMPAEAADDFAFVRGLVEGGMDVARVNCAHDDEDVWGRIVANVRRASATVRRPCRVLMDLGGPKLRAGAVACGPRVVKWKPERDAFGRVAANARVWLTAQGRDAAPPAPAAASLAVGAEWLAALRPEDHVRLDDARGATRVLTIGRCGDGGAWADCAQTAYVVPGTVLAVEREDADPRSTTVGDVPPRDTALRLRPGDSLVVTRPDRAPQAAEFDARGGLVAPASVSCTLPEVFGSVRPGDRIFFDDGRIGGVVRTADADRLVVEITHGRPEGEKLRGDCGINLPDSDLHLAALTPKDLADAEFVARHADAVSLSFVRDPADVVALHERLREVGGSDLGIVLKVETRQGFERLPELLLAAMRGPRVGVMIARGDLAVECGYERLAELQEECLWICEAAHVPAIWATQVLEGLAKTGLPTRAEITDAAMGERAEGVMLNKGRHLRDAVRTLDDILTRMAAHHRKKRSMLRPLQVARDFGSAR